RRRFFFQAEDGIRDRNVTGVQTCALPISPFSEHGASCGALTVPLSPPAPPPGWAVPAAAAASLSRKAQGGCPPLYPSRFSQADRSEERRVGEGWRGWGAARA